MVGSTCLNGMNITYDKLQYMYTRNQNYDIQNKREKEIINTYIDGKGVRTQSITLLYNAKTGNMAKNTEQLNNLDRLGEISILEENWNGYGGKCISGKVVSMAKKIVNQVCRQPVIFPTGRASIQMQYELEDRSYLEFEIFEEKIVCMKVPERVYSNAVFETFQDVDMVLINKIVGEFYGKQCTKR